MVAGFRITSWRAKKIADEVKEAAAAAINETMQAAADEAAAGRSGSVANVQVVEEASPQNLTGKWGVPPADAGDPFYELFTEVGTAFQAGDNAKRRAADSQYPQLADRIRDRRGG